MINNKHISKVILAGCAVLAALLSGCQQEPGQAEFTLSYPGVTNIGPSMSFNSPAPTYHGSKPSDFSITRITLDGTALECASFSINPESGIISITNTETLSTGRYAVSVACISAGKSYSFDDAFVARFLPTSPKDLKVSASEVEISYEEILSKGINVKIDTVGESVSLLGWELIQEEGCEYFAISKDGVISFDSSFEGEILPGEYTLSLKIISYAGEIVYNDILKVKITSKPLALTYPSASGKLEYNLSYLSKTPSLKGSKDSLRYSIAAVTPSTDKIIVDSLTAVVSVEKDNGLAIGDVYSLDITASNKYGSATFPGAFTLTVIAFIAPIDASTFKYADVESIQGSAFEADVASGLVGDELTFSLSEVPSELEGKISINPASGTVSAAKGNTIPVGSWTVKVKVENTKSEAQASLVLNIIENPYYFTYIRYGNNLGLPSDGTYASQYRVKSGADMAALSLEPETDIKDGIAVKWSLAVKQNCSGASIDASTGKITLSTSGYKANNAGLVLVSATTGEGSQGETTMTIPVFFSYYHPDNHTDIYLNYTPFVVTVNPAKGGRSAKPQLQGTAIPSDEKLFTVDYRRNFFYCNIGGPASHVSGQLSSSATTCFLYDLWNQYFDQVGHSMNAGSKYPMSYYVNNGSLSYVTTTDLSKPLGYVDGTTREIVVNPGKWYYSKDHSAANGAFYAQMTYVTSGNTDSELNSGTGIFPVWIWFDERF